MESQDEPVQENIEEREQQKWIDHRSESGDHSFRERVSSIRHLFPSFYFFLDFRDIMVGVTGRNIDTRIGAGDIVVSFAAVLYNSGCIGEVARNSTALDGRM